MLHHPSSNKRLASHISPPSPPHSGENKGRVQRTEIPAPVPVLCPDTDTHNIQLHVDQRDRGGPTGRPARPFHSGLHQKHVGRRSVVVVAYPGRHAAVGDQRPKMRPRRRRRPWKMATDDSAGPGHRSSPKWRDKVWDIKRNCGQKKGGGHPQEPRFNIGKLFKNLCLTKKCTKKAKFK